MRTGLCLLFVFRFVFFRGGAVERAVGICVRFPVPVGVHDVVLGVGGIEFMC